MNVRRIIFGVAALGLLGCGPTPLNGGLTFTGPTTAPRVPIGVGGESGGTGGATAPSEDAGSPIDPPPPPADASNSDAADARPDRVASGDLSLPRDGGGCQLVVKATSQTRDANYAPENIGAIWIQDSAGKFVKTLMVWAAARMSHLNQWLTVTAAAGLRQNRVDAVTSASKSSDGVRMASWNCTDTNHQVVADGNYSVCFELNEGNGMSRYDCVMFTKGDVAQEWKPADSPAYKSRVIDFSP